MRLQFCCLAVAAVVVHNVLEQDNSRPSSASRMNRRHGANSTAGFVELSPEHVLTPVDLFHKLEAVPGITKVEWQPAQESPRASQALPAAAQNILVYTDFCGSLPLKFWVHRQHHMSSPSVPFIVSVCFKAPSVDMVPEAWRILRTVTTGHELFPGR